jgi:hypothetical protein
MPAATPKPLPTHTAVTAGVLLAIPLAALLIVGLYAQDSPELWGFPFFYWYQLLWVFLASGCTAAAHAVIRRARQERDLREEDPR